MTVVPKQKRQRGRPRLGQEPSTAVSLRLDQASVAKLRAIAQTQGIGPTTLLRRWVLEQTSPNDPLHMWAVPLAHFTSLVS
jgi:hypothetical protein